MGRSIGFILVETSKKKTLRPVKVFAGALLSHTPVGPGNMQNFKRAGIMRDGKIYDMPWFTPIPATLDYTFIATMNTGQNAKWATWRKGFKHLFKLGYDYPQLIGLPINMAWFEWHMGLPEGWTKIEE